MGVFMGRWARRVNHHPGTIYKPSVVESDTSWAKYIPLPFLVDASTGKVRMYLSISARAGRRLQSNLMQRSLRSGRAARYGANRTVCRVGGRQASGKQPEIGTSIKENEKINKQQTQAITLCDLLETGALVVWPVCLPSCLTGRMYIPTYPLLTYMLSWKCCQCRGACNRLLNIPWSSDLILGSRHGFPHICPGGRKICVCCFGEGKKHFVHMNKT